MHYISSGLKEKNESSLCVLHLLLALPHGGMGLVQAGVTANTLTRVEEARQLKDITNKSSTHCHKLMHSAVVRHASQVSKTQLRILRSLLFAFFFIKF